MKTPLVSIITPAYNVARYLPDAIESVQAQTYPNWEMIIVDDESKDNTAEVVKEFVLRDIRVKYFWQKNGKQGRARNRGLMEAHGEYIAFLDADDVWLPNKLEQQLVDLRTYNVDLIFGHAYLLNQTIRTTERTGRGLGKYEGEEAVSFLLYHDAFVMSTVLAKKNIIDKVGGFETDNAIQYCEDWHMWLNLALQGFSFYTSGAPVSYYRVHPESAAKVEQHAKVKFFLALVNLCHRYPKHVKLNQETKKRGSSLIIHQDTLAGSLIDIILSVFYPKSRQKWQRLFLKAVSSISINLFRRLFLYWNRN